MPGGLCTPLSSQNTHFLPSVACREAELRELWVGKIPFLFSPLVCFDVLLSIQFFLCQKQLAWVVYTCARAHTNAGTTVYFIFVVYVCSGKRTHGDLHDLMEKPLENKEPGYCQSLAKGTVYFIGDISADSCSRSKCCKISRIFPFRSQRISSSFLTACQMSVHLLLPINRSQHEKW